MQEPSQSKKLELRISYLKNIQAPYEANHYYNLDSAQRDASITPGPIYENRYTSLIGNLPRVYFVQPEHERSQTRHTASTRCPKNLHRLKA
jgi:hypothetical protein